MSHFLTRKTWFPQLQLLAMGLNCSTAELFQQQIQLPSAVKECLFLAGRPFVSGEPRQCEPFCRLDHWCQGGRTPDSIKHHNCQVILVVSNAKSKMCTSLLGEGYHKTIAPFTHGKTFGMSLGMKEILTDPKLNSVKRASEPLSSETLRTWQKCTFCHFCVQW